MLRHFLEPSDFNETEYQELFRLADCIFNEPENFSNSLHGKVLASLFFEPSTRTMLSFDTAMKRLGGSTILFPPAEVSSLKKGETLEDTIRIMECYADICVLRHPENFMPHYLSGYLTTMPLINAGDGSNSHPTQTLADLLTIRHCFGKLHGLKVGFCGDAKYGRTVHSLYKKLLKHEDNSFVFITPENLSMPEEMISQEDRHRVLFSKDLKEVIGDLDILYMTRIQRERFIEEEDVTMDQFILDRETLSLGQDHLAVLHPLPRVDEITTEVDQDPRALYFQQVKFGMIGRMALILYVMELNHGKSYRE